MLSVVVPTYCEAENISKLVPLLHEQLSGKDGYEILVVDDLSPDDIVARVETLASDGFPVRILLPEGRERDLSLSVIDGIKAARHDTIVVMDADLSHPPEKVVELADVVTTDPTRFAIGSRYVADGSFDRDWSLWRFINSHVATMLTKPLVACRDPMSGFFAFNKSTLGDVSRLNPIGYKIGLEVLVRGDFSGVTEVPITFKDRSIGESKMNFAQQFKFLKHLRRLYVVKFGDLGELAHFVAIGASGFVIDLVLYLTLQLAGASHLVARAIAFWPAAIWNWRLNWHSGCNVSKRCVRRPTI